MELYEMPNNDANWFVKEPMLSYCVFCGNEYGSVNFKGKCVCDECINYVKEIL